MAQKVLITAAASGIGLEIARAFAEAGSTVFITDIHQQTIDAATIEIPGLIWSDRVNLLDLWVCCCRWFRRFPRTERAAVGAVFSDD